MTPEIEASARAAASELNLTIMPRNKRPFDEIYEQYNVNRVLVAYESGWQIRQKSPSINYSYHPNMAMVRLHNIAGGQRDLFAEATGLREGDQHLDCTAGFAAEATLAAHLVGSTGHVTALESDRVLAFVTREGLKTFQTNNKLLKKNLLEIQLLHADYSTFLNQCATNSFDVVYFDPFFDERLWGSQHSLDPLRAFGELAPLDAQAVVRAIGVARRRVVVKHPWKEPLPESLRSLSPARIETRKGRLVYSVFESADGAA